MTPLASAEGLTGLVFLFTVAVTVGGATLAACAANLIRAVTGLAIGFLGLAGLFYFLNSPFVALMEILIYVGAVCVALVFGIMLAPPRMDRLARANRNFGAAAALLACGTLFGLVAWVGAATDWPRPASLVNDGSVAAIGKGLLSTYSMVFELISLVLLVAILGALVVARSGRGLPQIRTGAK
ncbi:MAG TPA: NADH-quinone oxidoreductase subunit J [Desulfobacterales bacterium]|nr:NADH-quinone oxidoreductase subunit J [Desulfobacterales bacterium]